MVGGVLTTSLRSSRVGVPIIVRIIPLILLLFVNIAYAERPSFLPVSLQINSVTFSGEIATTPEQFAYGLMFRTSLADDYAMVFDFGEERQAGFWMKNTLLSLDMIFVKADGRIANIIKEVPPLSLDLRKSKGKVRWVIEVPAGTTTKHGIKVGDKVRF